MAATSVTSGVYPVFYNEFLIDITGTPTKAGAITPVADMTSFSVSVDNGIEEWTPMTTNGWVRRLMTGKSLTISVSGKRNVGDDGNDWLATLAAKTGQNAESWIVWNLPGGGSFDFRCVVNVTTLAGESTDVDALEVEFQSNGAVTYTPPTP